MKLFEDPKLEVVMLAVEDIVATSQEEDPGFFDQPCI